MKSITTILLRAAAIGIFCLTAASTPVLGQSGKLQLPNLEHLRGKAREIVDVSLDGSMLKLAGKFLSNESDEGKAKDVVDKVQGVYVKSFEFDKEGEYSEADVEAVRSQLKGPGWSRIVGVLSGKRGDNVEIYTMTEGGVMTDLAIISAEPKELTIVNIVGPVDLEKLSDLGGKLGVPKLEKEKKPKKD